MTTADHAGNAAEVTTSSNSNSTGITGVGFGIRPLRYIASKMVGLWHNN